MVAVAINPGETKVIPGQTIVIPDYTIVAAACPPPVDPPPVTPPPTGNAHSANTTAEVKALLLRKDIGVNPVIVVPNGKVLTPTDWGVGLGGTPSNRYTVRAETDGKAFVDIGGGKLAFRYAGAGYFDFEGFAFRNGKIDQNGVIDIGWAENGKGIPPGTKGVAFRRLTHDSTCTGPARAASGTNYATSHFIYVSGAKPGDTHDDIVVEDCVGHADNQGLCAMLHLYTSGTVVTRFVARRNTAYGYTQAVMAYSGGVQDALIEDFTGIDCYTVLRLQYGSGRVTNPKSSHPSTLPKMNPLHTKSSGWFIDSLANLN